MISILFLQWFNCNTYNIFTILFLYFASLHINYIVCTLVDMLKRMQSMDRWKLITIQIGKYLAMCVCINTDHTTYNIFLLLYLSISLFICFLPYALFINLFILVKLICVPIVTLTTKLSIFLLLYLSIYIYLVIIYLMLFSFI